MRPDMHSLDDSNWMLFFRSIDVEDKSAYLCSLYNAAGQDAVDKRTITVTVESVHTARSMNSAARMAAIWPKQFVQLRSSVGQGEPFSNEK